MKKSSKRIYYLILIIVTMTLFTLNVMAHSGRTDSNGGHKDNQNKSRLGGYHYHHGYGPHLHSKGICPYEPVKETKPATISVKDIYIDSDKILLDIGEVKTFSASIIPNNATDKTVNWSSNNNNVATVESGIITAIGEGTAKISARASNGKMDNIIVTVEKAVESILINEDNITLVTGDEKLLSVTIYPSDATNKNIKWISEDENIAIVSDSGKVAAKKGGITNISAISNNGKRNNITITVEKAEKIVDENKDIISSSEPVENKDEKDNNDILGIVVVGGAIVFITKYFRKSK